MQEAKVTSMPLSWQRNREPAPPWRSWPESAAQTIAQQSRKRGEEAVEKQTFPCIFLGTEQPWWRAEGQTSPSHVLPFLCLPPLVWEQPLPYLMGVQGASCGKTGARCRRRKPSRQRSRRRPGSCSCPAPGTPGKGEGTETRRQGLTQRCMGGSGPWQAFWPRRGRHPNGQERGPQKRVGLSSQGHVSGGDGTPALQQGSDPGTRHPSQLCVWNLLKNVPLFLTPPVTWGSSPYKA